MATPSIQSRIKGSIFGVAIVDALGAPVEFHARGTFDKVTGYRYNDTFNTPPGTWTDDTSLTLCLAKSLIDSKGKYVAQTAIRKYIDWYRRGYLSATGHCFDIGGSTRQALEIWESYFQQEQPGLAGDEPDGHEGGQPAINRSLSWPVRCGNGSLMRIAPVGLVFYRDMDAALSITKQDSSLTHPFPTCAECCVIYTRIIIHSLNGASKEDIAAKIAATRFFDNKIKDRLGRYTTIEDWKETDEDDIKSSGFVLSTLEAAVWSFLNSTTFEEGALKVVNLGYDADTVGAVYGGLAGAYYGREAIPTKWIDELQEKDLVEEIATGLASLVAE